MSYYSIQPCNDVKNLAKIKNLDSHTRIQFTEEEKANLKELIFLQVEANEESIFPDFILFPVFLVSAKIKEVIAYYDDQIIFKKCILMDNSQKIIEIYFLMIPKEIDCVDKNAEYEKNGRVRKFKIDNERTGGRDIFQTTYLNNTHLIVSMDLAESFLKRNIQGFTLCEIPTADITQKRAL